MSLQVVAIGVLPTPADADLTMDNCRTGRATVPSTSRCCASATAGRSAWTSPGRRRPAPCRASRRDARPRRPRSRSTQKARRTRRCATTTGVDRVGADGRDERQLAAKLFGRRLAGDAHPLFRDRRSTARATGRADGRSASAAATPATRHRVLPARTSSASSRWPVAIDAPAAHLAHLYVTARSGAGTGRWWADAEDGERTCASSTGRWPPGRRCRHDGPPGAFDRPHRRARRRPLRRRHVCRSGTAQFYEAARLGLDAQLRWLDGSVIGARTAAALLPLARSGLARLDVAPSLAGPWWLDLIAERLAARATGARQLRGWPRSTVTWRR